MTNSSEEETVTLTEAAEIIGVYRGTARTAYQRGLLGDNLSHNSRVRVSRAEVLAYAAERHAAPSTPEGEPLLRLRDLATLFEVKRETVDSWRIGRTRTLPAEDDQDHRGYPLYRLSTIDAFAEREGLPVPGRAMVLDRWGK